MVRRLPWNASLKATVFMMAYFLEMAAQMLGWRSFQLITGFAWGLFPMPILHGSQATKTPMKI
jgi:hypothetical protein